MSHPFPIPPFSSQFFQEHEYFGWCFDTPYLDTEYGLIILSKLQSSYWRFIIGATAAELWKVESKRAWDIYKLLEHETYWPHEDNDGFTESRELDMIITYTTACDQNSKMCLAWAQGKGE